MIRDTSALAYAKDILPTLGRRQMEVLIAMQARGDWSNAELAKHLNWPINTVTPRTKELRTMGYVIDAGEKRTCTVTGSEVHVWRLKNHKVEPVQGKLTFNYKSF